MPPVTNKSAIERIKENTLPNLPLELHPPTLTSSLSTLNFKLLPPPPKVFASYKAHCFISFHFMMFERFGRRLHLLHLILAQHIQSADILSHLSACGELVLPLFSLRMMMGGVVFSGPSLQSALVRRTCQRSVGSRLLCNRRPYAAKCRANLRASRASPPHPSRSSAWFKAAQRAARVLHDREKAMSPFRASRATPPHPSRSPARFKAAQCAARVLHAENGKRKWNGYR